MHINQDWSHFIKLCCVHTCSSSKCSAEFHEILIKTWGLFANTIMDFWKWLKKMLIGGKCQCLVLCICLTQDSDLDWMLLINASSDFYARRQWVSAFGQKWPTSQEFIKTILFLSQTKWTRLNHVKPISIEMFGKSQNSSQVNLNLLSWR